MLTAIDYQALSEDALVMHARTGDREAFRAIMQRCNQRLFRIARAVLGNDDEAEDALQEAYLHAFAAIAGFRGEAGLFTWLSAIMLNEARARLRRRRRTVDMTAIENQPNVVAFPLTAAPAGPEDEAARAQMRRLLERAVDDLPLDFRLVFLLREVEGCSVEDTAAQLGLKPATVKTRLHRARRSLREALDKQLSGAFGDAFAFLGARCNAITEAVLQRLDR